MLKVFVRKNYEYLARGKKKITILIKKSVYSINKVTKTDYWSNKHGPHKKEYKTSEKNIKNKNYTRCAY